MVARLALNQKIEVRILAGEPCLRFIIVTYLLVLASCSVPAAIVGGSSPSQLDVEVKNAPRSVMDPIVEKQSEALHSFLVGQLAYGKENYPQALENFSKASELTQVPVPILHARLAELYVKQGLLERALAESEKALQAEPDNRNTLLLHAGILEALNREGEAQPIYEQLIAKEPDSVDVYVLLATLHTHKKEYAKAEELLTGFLKRKPKEALAHYYLGRIYEAHENLAQAEQHYQLASDLEPGSPQMKVDLMRVLVKSKNFTKLRGVCEQILERDPENLLARRVLGQISLGENKFDEALGHLQVLQSSAEDAMDARFKIALIQIQKQNFSEAIRELNLILAQQSDHEEARYQLGSVLASTGQPKEAIEELRKIKPEQSLFVRAYTLAAVLLRQEGRLAEAEDTIRQALEVKPDDSQTLGYLVLILRDAQKLEEAKDTIERMLKEDPDNERMLFNYAVLLHEMKQEEESLQEMERVVQLNPTHSDALNYIAYGLAEKSVNLERALTLIQRALETRPNDGFYLDTLGWIYYRMGRIAEAEEVLERAANLTNDDPEVLEHYGEVLHKTGDEEKAVRVYRSAAEKLRAKKHEEKHPGSKEQLERLEKKLEELQHHSDARGIYYEPPNSAM